MTKRQVLMNTDRMRVVLERGDLDAILPMSLENFHYVTGASLEVQRYIKERIGVVVWPQEGTPTVMVRSGEVSRVKEETWLEDIRPYREFEQSPMQVLAGVLKEKGLERGRIGIEKQYLLAQYYEEIQKFLPKARFVECGPLIDEVKMIKTPGEIEVLRTAFAKTEKAVQIAYRFAQPGDTTRSVAAWMGYALMNSGAEAIAFILLASGARSTHKHPTPDENPITPGETVRVDIGGLFDGYFSDLARMAVVGEPSQKQRDTYLRLIDIHREVTTLFRSGTVLSEICRKGSSLMERKGLPLDKHHLGHSIGTTLHEEPFIALHEKREIQPNMVFALEPSYTEPGVARYHIEDLVWVSDKGPIMLSSQSDTSRMLVIE